MLDNVLLTDISSPFSPLIAGHNLSLKAFLILEFGSESIVNERALPPFVEPMAFMSKWEVSIVVET